MPLPDRRPIELVDRFLQSHHEAHAATERARRLAVEVVAEYGPDQVLVRNGLALVPTGEATTITLEVRRYRDLDVEHFVDDEARLIRAASVAMTGGVPPDADKADLVQLARESTDATEFEAFRAVDALRKLGPDLEARHGLPHDLPGLATLLREVLDGFRADRRPAGGRPVVDGPPFDDLPGGPLGDPPTVLPWHGA